MRRATAVRLACAGLACAGVTWTALGHPAPAAPEHGSESANAKLDPPLARMTLDSGLRVVVLPEPRARSVAIAIAYDAGSRDEIRGRSGLASIVAARMAAAGGPLATSHRAEEEVRLEADRLLFVDTLPAAELPFGLWLEARRLDPSRPIDWSRARDAAIDERRARIDDVAYARAALRLDELIHEGDWAYAHPALAAPHDLRAADGADAAELEARHVGPNHAALAIVGNIAPNEAFGLAKRWLGGVRPASSTPAPPPAGVRSASAEGGRQAIVEDAHAKLGALFEGWAIPPGDEAERDAIAVAATILGDGHGSRLVRLLVEEQPLANEVMTDLRERRGPGELVVRVVLASGARADAVQRALDAQIAELGRTGPTDAEMKRARARLDARLAARLATPSSAAVALAEAELAGDADQLLATHARRVAVGKDAVRRAVAKLLVPGRRSLVEVRPGAERERDKR